MTREELQIHLDESRRILQEVKDLGDRIPSSDHSDDADNLRRSYENVRKELRYILARQYDAETIKL